LAEAKIPRIGSPQSFSDSPDSSQGHPRMASPQYAFHVIKKYKVGNWAALHTVISYVDIVVIRFLRNLEVY
jgi:hypothetical protein